MTRKAFTRLAAASPFGAALSGSAQAPPPRKTFPAGGTAALVSFITRTRLERIPDRAIVEAKRCLIDGFGIVLAGATVQGSGIVREYVKATSAPGGSAILGPARMSAAAAHAALALATAAPR